MRNVRKNGPEDDCPHAGNNRPVFCCGGLTGRKKKKKKKDHTVLRVLGLLPSKDFSAPL